MTFRDTYLHVVVAVGVLVAAVTEALSAVRLLSFWPLLLTWAILATALSTAVAIHLHRSGLISRGVRKPRLNGLDLVVVVWMILMIAGTGALALFAVPTTADSLVYHLARVAHWAQNRTVAFYPTPTFHQLYLSPWAEYAILHLFILSGGDRLANLVQWGSMLSCLVGVSLIARELGASVRGQVLTCFVCVTVPMGIMQASTTQNDYVVSMWLVTLVYALVMLESQPRVAPLLAGASLGLAMLTKGTTYFFALPFLAYFLVRRARRSFVPALGQGLVIALCAIALNAPHFARNLEVFGAPLGPRGIGPFIYANAEMSPTILASNTLRNIALHVGTPWGALNTIAERTIGVVDAKMGVAPDDPRSTWYGVRFAVNPLSAHEALAGNGFHLLLIVVAGVGAFSMLPDRRMRGYVICLVLGFLLFCLILRWQPWHSRLHLPLFILGAPIVGVVFQKVNAQLLAAGCVLLASSSSYFLLKNETHRLFGRGAVFRMSRTEQRVLYTDPAYTGAARAATANGCTQLGLIIGFNDPEYVLWSLLPDIQARGRIEHVANVDHPLLPEPGRNLFQPCAIIRVDPSPRASLQAGGQTYRGAWSKGIVQVLVPDPGATADTAGRQTAK